MAHAIQYARYARGIRNIHSMLITFYRSLWVLLGLLLERNYVVVFLLWGTRI
jgi:hypothetical protein